MEIPSVNCGNVVGKVERNLQNGTKYQQNSVGNLSVIYLRKVRRYFVSLPKSRKICIQGVLNSRP